MGVFNRGRKVSYSLVKPNHFFTSTHHFSNHQTLIKNTPVTNGYITPPSLYSNPPFPAMSRLSKPARNDLPRRMTLRTVLPHERKPRFVPAPDYISSEDEEEEQPQAQPQEQADIVPRSPSPELVILETPPQRAPQPRRPKRERSPPPQPQPEPAAPQPAAPKRPKVTTVKLSVEEEDGDTTDDDEFRAVYTDTVNSTTRTHNSEGRQTKFVFKNTNVSERYGLVFTGGNCQAKIFCSVAALKAYVNSLE